MNNSQEIILAQISAIYDKPPFVKVKTGQMEMILKCVGLGKYYDEYAKYLEPYWYNRGFQNDIESYRIFVGLNSIFEDLLNAHNDILFDASKRKEVKAIFQGRGSSLAYLPRQRMVQSVCTHCI